MLTVICIATLVVLVNASAFMRFMLDKRCAESRLRRVAESTLLLVALIGGSAGAIAGQQYWRHKTSKEPFRPTLSSIAGMEIFGQRPSDHHIAIQAMDEIRDQRANGAARGTPALE